MSRTSRSSLHERASHTWKKPTAQLVHTDAPADSGLAVDTTEAFPGSHTAHALAPVTELKRPDGHTLQSTVLVTLVNWPTLHCVQELCAMAEADWPRGHDLQAASPVVSAK
jgi:hypothetical protein